MLGCMMRPPGTPVSWSEAASSTDSPKSEAHSRHIDVAADRRPERGQVITAFRFSSDQREAKGRRLMYVLQTRMLHRQRGSAGWPVATVLSDRLHRPAHRKAASNPRRLSVLRAEQAAALRRHRKAERPRSLSERLRLAGTPRPAMECDTPCAAEDAEMLREGEDADDRSVTDKVSNAQMPTNGVGADQMPSFEDVSQFEGEMARDGGLADGADDLGGSEDDKQVNCCRCGVVLDRSDGVTIRPAIGDCDAAGCGHWACLPCSGVAEGYMGPWCCGCSRCGTSVQRSSRPGGCAGVASAAPAPSLPVTLLVKSSPPVARSPGQSAPPNAARAPSCDTSGTRRDLLIRPLPAGDATLAWGGGRAAAESDSDDEPGDHIPLSQRKRPLAPMARAAPAAVKPKVDAKGVVAPAASGAKRQGSGEHMAGTPGGSIRRKKVPRVRLKLNGKIETGDGLAVLLEGKRESERGARDGSIGAAQSAMLVAGTTADAPAALSSAGGGALDGAPCGDEGAAGSSSDLDSTREAPGDGSLSTLLTQDEAASACARTLGARLIDRYRRRKARSSEARKLTMHSMVAPTWLDSTASATDVVGSSTVASRGSRREHRQLVRGSARNSPPHRPYFLPLLSPATWVALC